MANEKRDGWVQDPDGGWHKADKEPAVGKLGQAVIAVVLVAVVLAGCVWWFNRSVDESVKTSDTCQNFPDLPSCR